MSETKRHGFFRAGGMVFIHRDEVERIGRAHGVTVTAEPGETWYGVRIEDGRASSWSGSAWCRKRQARFWLRDVCGRAFEPQSYRALGELDDLATRVEAEELSRLVERAADESDAARHPSAPCGGDCAGCG